MQIVPDLNSRGIKHDLEAFVSDCWISHICLQRIRHLVSSLDAWRDIASIHQVYITTLGSAVVCLSLSLPICPALAASFLKAALLVFVTRRGLSPPSVLSLTLSL